MSKMTDDAITALIAHCQTTLNAHALVVVSSGIGAYEIASRIASRIAQMGIQVSFDSQSGDFVADFDNVHGGKGRISVRVVRALDQKLAERMEKLQ